MSVSNSFPTKWNAFQATNYLRCSVIPLVGGDDVQAGKRPAVTWAVYQKHLPSRLELQRWFIANCFSAYGIVCGRISKLVVLDLDDAQLALRVFARFPHLTNTFIVASGSRGTPHIYWHVDFEVKTCAFRGGDLKAEGSYVVGPGSRMGSAEWTVLRSQPVRQISRVELDEVMAFVGYQQRTVEAAAARADAPPAPNIAPHRDFVAIYRLYADKGGSRNRALFDVVRYVRDHGFSEAGAVKLLAQVHAQEPPRGDHPPETYSQRYVEALRTIGSVYTRPAQPLPEHMTVSEEGISRYPNSVREALLRRPDGAAIARVIEGVVLLGVQAICFTEAQLYRLLKGLLSRETLRKALAACYPNQQPIFRISPPVPPLTTPTEVDTDVSRDRQKECSLSGGQNRTKRFYHIPSPHALCLNLGVALTPGDPITLEDIKSAKRYRQALHRALIERRPGKYSQSLLAGRVGICRRTIRRYNRQTAVHTQPTYEETPVTWFNLETLPPAAALRRYDLQMPGTFLIDDTGKRWPLKREIARKLLRQGRKVSQMRQGVNYYWVGLLPMPQPAAISPIVNADADANGLTPLQDAKTLEAMLDHYEQQYRQMTAQGVPAARTVTASPEAPELAQEAAFAPFYEPARQIAHIPAATPPKPQGGHSYRQPLPDSRAERLAQRVHEAANDLSLPNARRLIETYGYDSVDATLRRMKWLQARGKIYRPGGFMVVAARCTWRIHNNADRLNARVPRFRAEPKGTSAQAQEVR